MPSVLPGVPATQITLLTFPTRPNLRWDHFEAAAGAYEQLVFGRLWAVNALDVRSHAALVPMAAMNSHAGDWWTAGGKLALSSPSGTSLPSGMSPSDNSPTEASPASSLSFSPVVHLMQRSEVVRRAVGLAAVRRLCAGKPLLTTSQLHGGRPHNEGKIEGSDDGSGDGAALDASDWVFEASRWALLTAAADLFATAAVAANQTSPGGAVEAAAADDDAGRVLLDSLMLLQSPEAANAAAREMAIADDAAAIDWVTSASATAAAATAAAAAAASSSSLSSSTSGATGPVVASLARGGRGGRGAQRVNYVAGEAVAFSGAALDACAAHHRAIAASRSRSSSSSSSGDGGVGAPPLAAGYRACLGRASLPSAAGERAAFAAAAAALLRSRWDGRWEKAAGARASDGAGDRGASGNGRGGDGGGGDDYGADSGGTGSTFASQPVSGSALRDELLFLEALAASNFANDAWRGPSSGSGGSGGSGGGKDVAAPSSYPSEKKTLRGLMAAEARALGSVALWRRSFALRSHHLPALQVTAHLSTPTQGALIFSNLYA